MFSSDGNHVYGAIAIADADEIMSLRAGGVWSNPVILRLIEGMFQQNHGFSMIRESLF